MLVADMILTTTEGPLSALLPLLLSFLVSRTMCSEQRVRVRALEYWGPDTADPSVSVALLVELRKEPGSMLRSLEMAVGVRDAPSCCQPAVLMGVTKVNWTLWSADQEDQLRVLNFPLVMSSLNVSSLTGGSDEKRTLPLCVSVNGEGWTHAGWIFFPPFQEANSDSDSKDVVSDSKHVASDSKHVATDSKHVASDSKLVASDSKLVASDSEHRESDGVGSSLEVSQTETTMSGMA